MLAATNFELETVWWIASVNAQLVSVPSHRILIHFEYSLRKLQRNAYAIRNIVFSPLCRSSHAWKRATSSFICCKKQKESTEKMEKYHSYQIRAVCWLHVLWGTLTQHSLDFFCVSQTIASGFFSSFCLSIFNIRAFRALDAGEHWTVKSDSTEIKHKIHTDACMQMHRLCVRSNREPKISWGNFSGADMKYFLVFSILFFDMTIWKTCFHRTESVH